MTVQKAEQISKRVEFKAADDERQIATGVVMVPDKVDLQGDFVREATIRSFAEDYMARLPQGEAAQGVMHAVWPDEHITLVENTVLDQAREIGGEEVPAGSWTQSFKFDDNELWTLVRDDILSGYSIGAESVRWSEPMEQGDLPDDVAVAADYPDDAPAWELQDGTVVENSAVDIPAVPDAQILATKDAAEKRVADLIGDKEQFVAEMRDRGHSEGEADRLWNYLRRAVDEQDVDASSQAGWLARAKSFFKDGPGSDTSSKESRTLSQANRERLMAAHDAVEDALASDVDFSTNRFTDNPTVDFDVADFGNKAAPNGGGEGGTNSSKDTMTDTPDDDPMKDAPKWAKALHEEQQKNSDAIEDLREKDGGDPDDPDAGKSLEDAPEWAKALHEQTEKNAEKVEDLAKTAGQSQQLGGGNNESESKTSKADILGLPGGDN